MGTWVKIGVLYKGMYTTDPRLAPDYNSRTDFAFDYIGTTEVGDLSGQYVIATDPLSDNSLYGYFQERVVAIVSDPNFYPDRILGPQMNTPFDNSVTNRPSYQWVNFNYSENLGDYWDSRDPLRPAGWENDSPLLCDDQDAVASQINDFKEKYFEEIIDQDRINERIAEWEQIRDSAISENSYDKQLIFMQRTTTLAQLFKDGLGLINPYAAWANSIISTMKSSITEDKQDDVVSLAKNITKLASMLGSQHAKLAGQVYKFYELSDNLHKNFKQAQDLTSVVDNFQGRLDSIENNLSFYRFERHESEVEAAKLKDQIAKLVECGSGDTEFQIFAPEAPPAGEGGVLSSANGSQPFFMSYDDIGVYIAPELFASNVPVSTLFPSTVASILVTGSSKADNFIFDNSKDAEIDAAGGSDAGNFSAKTAQIDFTFKLNNAIFIFFKNGKYAALHNTEILLSSDGRFDPLLGLGGKWVMNGTSSEDRLIGSNGDDVITGAAGSDTLDGSVGVDTMSGGRDDDTFIVDNAADVIVETADEGGADRVKASVSYVLATNAYIEQLTTTLSSATTAINLTGNALKQEIIGNYGDNILHDGGKGEADHLRGLSGNDTYRIFNTGDTIVESAAQGTADKVVAAVSYTLGSGVFIETMQTNGSTGTSPINLTGNSLHQEIIGNNGSNVLNTGGGAADYLRGLSGNDTYRVFNAADTIVESAAQGTADKVVAAVSYVLGAGVYIETMQTNGSTGTSTINLTGNEVAQSIVGNQGANRLEGMGGADTLRGFGGADTFVFATKLGGGNVDKIVDFNPADDRFLLSDNIFTALVPGTLPNAAFRANTSGLAQDTSDRVIYDTDGGGLFYDPDGTGAAAAIQFAIVGLGLGITRADFSVA